MNKVGCVHSIYCETIFLWRRINWRVAKLCRRDESRWTTWSDPDRRLEAAGIDLNCTRFAHCASCRCFAEGFPHFHLIPFNKGSDTDLSIMETFSNKYRSICWTLDLCYDFIESNEKLEKIIYLSNSLY